jgi:murein DD-endopeptidase MepM/ murein hydrolase activator NlpD
MLDRLEPDLRASEVRCDARALAGCGRRRHLDTAGWTGEWFAGAVRFTVERTRDGWEWTGISPFAPTEAWVKQLEPDERATNQPLSLPIKAPWPAGIRMRAGGLLPYIGEQAAIVAASFIPFVGWSIAQGMTYGFAARDCGFGPGVLYYNMAPTHLTSVASSAFAIDFVRYLQFVPYANVAGATPALSIAPGIVTLRDAGFVSGDGDPNHPNTVHIRHVIMGAIQLKGGGFVNITISTPFVSRYLHMAGPNLIPVSVGMFVRQGARLGTMDDTGSSAFDHLHFSIHDDAMGGASVRPNPMDGQPLTDSDDGRCILSSNVPFP